MHCSGIELKTIYEYHFAIVIICIINILLHDKNQYFVENNYQHHLEFYKAIILIK